MLTLIGRTHPSCKSPVFILASQTSVRGDQTTGKWNLVCFVVRDNNASIPSQLPLLRARSVEPACWLAACSLVWCLPPTSNSCHACPFSEQGTVDTTLSREQGKTNNRGGLRPRVARTIKKNARPLRAEQVRCAADAPSHRTIARPRTLV